MSDEFTGLEVIVRETGLEPIRATAITEKFQDIFELAISWKTRAESIVVTDESDTVGMKLARVGRLELKAKRVAIEHTRKELKERALREGQAIDKIANFLKGLIIPIEDHLFNQEKFVELRDKAIEDARLAEEARLAEVARLAAEAEVKAEQDRIAAENKKLQAEVDEKNRLLKEEREAADAKQRAIEEKAAAESRAAAEKERAAQKEIDDLKRKAEEDARKLAEAKAKLVTCPQCGHEFLPDNQIKEIK